MGRTCFTCGGTRLVRQAVATAIEIGSHAIIEQSWQDVCQDCGAGSTVVSQQQQLELHAAVQVLTQHKLTGAMLRDLRRVLRLKQKELADRFGVASESVSRWERDERPMEPWVALAIEGLVRKELMNSQASRSVGSVTRIVR